MINSKNVVVFNLGCKVNQYECDVICDNLKNKGYQISQELEPADVYVINTCAVTAEAEKKSRQAIARCRALNASAKILVVGCASQKNPQSFVKDNVTYISGVAGKFSIDSHLNNEIQDIDIKELPTVYEDGELDSAYRTRSYIKIQDGCNNFCSYCLIPYLRGRIRSRSVESIKREIDYLQPEEVVLTGINLSAYNYNGIDLAELLNLLKDCKCRIRLGSLEVNVVDERFLNACKNLFDFAPHFHLSLQSGSDKVLREMNRHYTKEEYLKKVELIRSYFPLAGITTDVICGFSTETIEDFEESYETCKKAEFSDIHCFTYSKREGTKAFLLKELSPAVKQERLEKMLELKQKLKVNFLNKLIGKELSFLPESFKNGYTEGYTENYVRVYVKGKVSNQITKIKIIEIFNDGCLAVEI